MSFRDRDNVVITVGDLAIYKDSIYVVRFIESYASATVAILENVKTHLIESPLLHDIVKYEG